MIDLTEERIKLTQFDNNPRINRTPKLTDVTEVVLTLDELDNTNNLENGKPSNTLLMYHVTACDNSMHFEPVTPLYNQLRNREFASLNLRITHMKNNIITDGPATTVVLHIQQFFCLIL